MRILSEDSGVIMASPITPASPPPSRLPLRKSRIPPPRVRPKLSPGPTAPTDPGGGVGSRPAQNGGFINRLGDTSDELRGNDTRKTNRQEGVAKRGCLKDHVDINANGYDSDRSLSGGECELLTNGNIDHDSEDDQEVNTTGDSEGINSCPTDDVLTGDADDQKDDVNGVDHDRDGDDGSGDDEDDDFNPLANVHLTELPEIDDHIPEYAGLDGVDSISPNSGQEVQRISVITTLPELLDDSNNADCMRRVVPKIREVLHVAQTEMQLAACTAFLQILQKKLVPVSNYTQTFLQTILMSLDNRDPDIAGAWLDTLLDVIDLLPKDAIKKDILSIAIAKGQLSQSVQSRLSCCRILGKIATKFEPFVIKKDILPVVQSLCQDVDYEVRGCMCRQLDPVARGLGLDHTKSAILPELVELTNDEESHVRLAGLETVVNILTLLDDETSVNTIVPLVCKFCQQALSHKDSTLPAVAKQLGKLVHGLSSHLSDEQRKWFLDYYKKLCKVGENGSGKQPKETGSGSKQMEQVLLPEIAVYLGGEVEEQEDETVECRRNAGYNYPAMVMFMGAKSFKTDLHHTMAVLCNDSNYKVRRTVAHGLHEVSKLLGSSVHLILPDLIKLLQDESTDVLKGLASHLPETLELLAKYMNTTESKMNAFMEVIPAMLACETVISASNNWRLQQLFITQLQCLPSCFPSPHIYSKFIPLLFRKLYTARALPVKHAAACTLLILMRLNTRLEQRHDMCHRFIEDLCHARSFYQRTLFIDLCRSVIQLYSRAFFKENFFEVLLELAQDPVPNVRLRLCPLLPILKSLIKLPSDRSLLQQLEGCVRRMLSQEQDRDVRHALECAVTDLDRVQVQMESKKTFSEEDLLDQKKEQDEKTLLDLEEKERREEEARSAKGGDRKLKETKKDSKIPAPKRSGKSVGGASSSSVNKDKSQGTRSERSSSFGGSVGSAGSSGTVHRTPSLNAGTNRSTSRTSRDSLGGSPRANRRIHSPTGLNNSRKGSASSVSSTSSASTASSSGSSVKTRRSSLETRKSTSGTRRPSVGTVSNTSIAKRK